MTHRSRTDPPPAGKTTPLHHVSTGQQWLLPAGGRYRDRTSDLFRVGIVTMLSNSPLSWRTGRGRPLDVTAHLRGRCQAHSQSSRTSADVQGHSTGVPTGVIRRRPATSLEPSRL